ncbi:unnamed protein product, partial [Staurois parvus]
DGFSNGNPPERCPRPLYSRDSTQEHQEIPQEDQEENLINIKIDVKDEEDPYESGDELSIEVETPPEISRDPRDTRTTQREVKTEEEEEGRVRIKEEEDLMEISTGAANNQNPPQRCPSLHDSWNSKEEHDEILQDDQDESFIKVEVKEEAEEMVDELFKEEEDEFPPEIRTDGRYRRYRMEKSSGMSLDGDIEGGDIIAESSALNAMTLNLHPDPTSAPSTHGVRCPPPIAHLTNGTRSEDFSREADLTLHQRGPQKQKPFSCSECGKCFTLKQQLVRHPENSLGREAFFLFGVRKMFPRKMDAG